METTRDQLFVGVQLLIAAAIAAYLPHLLLELKPDISASVFDGVMNIGVPLLRWGTAIGVAAYMTVLTIKNTHAACAIMLVATCAYILYAI